MTHGQFEETFAARKAAYRKRMSELLHEMQALKAGYRQGNAELERQRAAALSNPENRRRHECFRLNHVLGGVFSEWESKETDVLDVRHAVSKFDCTGDDAAVLTIRVPYLTDQAGKEAAYDGQ